MLISSYYLGVPITQTFDLVESQFVLIADRKDRKVNAAGLPENIAFA